jgi:hypothetical protein
LAEWPAPKEGIALTHFVVSNDVEPSRRFYPEVLGGKTVMEDEPTIVALANGCVIINVGGGPADNKPTVTLETPPEPDRVSSFLNIRVADIRAIYNDWSARGRVPDAATGPRTRDALLPPRPRRAPHRGWAGDGRPTGADA